MTALAQAAKAYGSTQTHIRTPRGLEYEVLARVTRALQACSHRRQSRYPDLVRALHDNRRIWTHLAASVSEGDNSLPSELRAQLFYLAEFTTVQSRRVLNQGADLGILVEINSAVMRGLMSKGT